MKQRWSKMAPSDYKSGIVTIFVLELVLTFHGHACKGVKLTIYFKIDLFTRKTLWLLLSKLQNFPSKSWYLHIRAFKWSIFCFCSIFCSCTISVWIKKTENFWLEFWQDWMMTGLKEDWPPMTHDNSWSINYHCAMIKWEWEK